MSDLLFDPSLGIGAALDSFGRVLVERVVPLNVWTAALVAGALLVDRSLARRARASLRIALYAPVALRVVLPLDWGFHFESAAPVAMLLAPLTTVHGASVDAATSPAAFSWWVLAAITYVGVVAALVARAVLARVALRRAIAQAPRVDATLRGASWPVVRHDELGPMVVGPFAPRIVLPARLLAAGEEKALDAVLRHETAHLRRGDAWLSVAMQALTIVAWPVASVWIATARVRQLVELACDEEALEGADATERRSYGHTLLDMAEWRARGVAPIGAGALHFGSTLRARIEALASARHWPLALQAGVVTLAPLGLLVACGGAAPPPSTSASADDDTGYGYRFETDSAKAIAASSPSTPIPAGEMGRVPPERVQAVVREHFSAIKACYDAGLATNAKLAGIVTVKAVIGKDGVTREAADEQSTLPDRAVVACIVREFGKLTYTPGSGVMTVVYPIELAP